MHQEKNTKHHLKAFPDGHVSAVLPTGFGESLVKDADKTSCFALKRSHVAQKESHERLIGPHEFDRQKVCPITF